MFFSLYSVTSGVSSRTASPVHVGLARPAAESSALLSDASESEATMTQQKKPSEQTQLSKHQFIVAATVHMEAH